MEKPNLKSFITGYILFQNALTISLNEPREIRNMFLKNKYF